MLARCRVHEVSQEWGCEWGSSYMNESIHSVSSHDCRFLPSRMRWCSLVITRRRSRGSKWWPKNDLLATLRPSDPMKTAVPSHAHDSVNAATIVLATTAMPTEHQEGTRMRRSRGSKSWPEIDLLAAFRL